MEQYKKTEGNRYYLKQLNPKTKELEWVEIKLVSSTKVENTSSPNEKIILASEHDYYFEDERIEEVNWDNMGYYDE